MHSIKYSYMNSKDVSPTCFGTSVPSSRVKICWFLKPIANDNLFFTRFYIV